VKTTRYMITILVCYKSSHSSVPVSSLIVSRLFQSTLQTRTQIKADILSTSIRMHSRTHTHTNKIRTATQSTAQLSLFSLFWTLHMIWPLNSTATHSHGKRTGGPNYLPVPSIECIS